MSSRFQVYCSRDGRRKRLYIKLIGILDGEGARRVIDLLKDKARGVNVTVVETDELEAVEPAGAHTFERGLWELGALCCQLVFYGRHGPALAPAWVDWI